MTKCQIAFIAGCLFILCSAFGQERPNILWITIEDTSPQFVGCYGNEDASTPVIDQLAKEGVRFTNAFSTGSVCSASRSSIITGVRTYQMGTGHQRSRYPIPDFIHGFPYYLKEQGYYATNNKKTDYNVADIKAFTAEAWDESSNTAGWWTRNPEQPFFSVFNFMDSHQSRTMSMTYDWYTEKVLDELPEEAIIEETAFDMPPIYRDSPEMRKQFARVYNSIKLTDINVGKLLQKLEDDNLRDDTIIVFYADHGEGIPRGKTNGINLGYRVPFIIWFPEKFEHLSPWGTGGVVSDELITFEDLAPTMISLTGREVPDYMKGRTLMGPDRSKTVDRAVLSTDRTGSGVDLVRTVTDGKYLYSRNFMPFMPEMRYIRYVEIGEITQHMRNDLEDGLLKGIQKSIFEPRPAEYLFNIEDDIWETYNLVGDPKASPILDKMRKALDKEMLAAKDVLFLPEYEIGLISKSGTPYEYRLDKEKYPFQKIYASAQLSGKRGDKIAKKQIGLLNDKNKIVRYWASMALLSQNKEVLDKYEPELTNALKDGYPPVVINVATLLYETFDNSRSKTILSDYCKDENLDLALQTITNLLYVEKKEPFVETVQAVLDLPDRNYYVRGACLDFLDIMGLVADGVEN